jgi:hypothetical protein
MSIGGQFHSISASGMALFTRPIESTLGGVVVDLASAPIAPGKHRLEITAGIGGIEIYLPRSVMFIVEGSAAVGGRDIHEGLPVWDRTIERVKAWLRLPTQVPKRAVDSGDPAHPVVIHIVVDGAIGGLDIYRM